ncbi:MAG: 2-keto-4-pentenoate hydratase [Leptolyngbyaceae cyanobacterium]
MNPTVRWHHATPVGVAPLTTLSLSLSLGLLLGSAEPAPRLLEETGGLNPPLLSQSEVENPTLDAVEDAAEEDGESDSHLPDRIVIDITRAEAITIAERLAPYYEAKVPLLPVLAPLGRADAAITMNGATYLRDAFVNQLTPQLGRIVGYKAGLTSPPAQARFGVEHPLRGILLREMLLESGAIVPANVGARPLVEADLMVRVGSVAINHATTREEAIASLDAVIPFIELPDLLLEPDIEPTAADLVAINVGARLGVMGTPIALTSRLDGRSWLDVLGDTPVEMRNADTGEIIAEGNTQALLGHPLDAVLWLVQDLQASGQWLHIGDVLSLGSITMPLPLEPDQTIRLRYDRLATDGSTAEVRVTIAPLEN